LSVQEIPVSKHARFLSGNDNKGSFFKIAENWHGATRKRAFSNTHVSWASRQEKLISENRETMAQKKSQK